MKKVYEIQPVEKPIQRERPQFGIGIELIEVDALIKAGEARARYRVDGKGFCVAVLDTGINEEHVDFTNKILTQVNFTTDNSGDPDDAGDRNGHGCNVAGIIVAKGDHVGVAPGADVIPIKVLNNDGEGSFDEINEGLQWVLDNHEEFNISVVCMSIGGSLNFQDDDDVEFGDETRQIIQSLEAVHVATVVSAGNDFFKHDSEEGMSFPAIIRECVSVGAVYDNIEGSFSYRSGAVAFSTAPDRITPFSQRLHPSTHPACFTDIFCPGAPVTSSGMNGRHGESTQHGTSQAAPVACGVILLLQEFYQRATGKLPEVKDLIKWIRSSAITIHDGDDESDNVENTRKDYKRLDAVRACGTIQRNLEVSDLFNSGILSPSS